MTTATLSPADAYALKALRDSGSPYADMFERTAIRDARLEEICTEFDRALAEYRGTKQRLFFDGVGQQFAPEPISRVRMARTETRRPRRGLLRRAWEWFA